VHYFKTEKKKVEGCCLYKVQDSGPVKHTHLSIKVRHMKIHTMHLTENKKRRGILQFNRFNPLHSNSAVYIPLYPYKLRQ